MNTSLKIVVKPQKYSLNKLYKRTKSLQKYWRRRIGRIHHHRKFNCTTIFCIDSGVPFVGVERRLLSAPRLMVSVFLFSHAFRVSQCFSLVLLVPMVQIFFSLVESINITNQPINLQVQSTFPLIQVHRIKYARNVLKCNLFNVG